MKIIFNRFIIFHANMRQTAENVTDSSAYRFVFNVIDKYPTHSVGQIRADYSAVPVINAL